MYFNLIKMPSSTSSATTFQMELPDHSCSSHLMLIVKLIICVLYGSSPAQSAFPFGGFVHFYFGGGHNRLDTINYKFQRKGAITEYYCQPYFCFLTFVFSFFSFSVLSS